jgi:hypothetical protein
MSEERFEQDQAEGETEDVEGHAKKVMANEEPGADDESSDDVEAHQRRAQKHTSN